MKLLKSTLFLGLVFSMSAWGAGSSATKSVDKIVSISSSFAGTIQDVKARVIQIDFVGDDTTGAMPNYVLEGVRGYLIKAVTNPGATGPTDNYDITMTGSLDTSFDVLEGILDNRDTSNTEQVYTLVSGAVTPVFLHEDHTIKIANTSVNDATMSLELVFLERL